MSTYTVDGLHWGTAHARHGISPHALDFGLYPLPFKPYGRAQALPLDRPENFGAFSPISGGQPAIAGPLPPLKSFLSSLLYLAYGVTSVRQAGGLPFLIRTVPSAGGLYPCHLYVGILPEHREETGVYYYDPPGHRLIQIRSPKGGTGGLDGEKPLPPLAFMVTACLYNSAWKYRDRALRYVLLDTGHLVENLVTAARDLNPALSPAVGWDFEDAGLARLLGLDLAWEVPLALVTLNWNKSVSSLVQSLDSQSAPSFPEVRTRSGEVEYLTRYPLPAKAHAAGQVRAGDRVGPAPVWSGPALETLAFPGPGAERIAEPAAKAALPELITRRRSCRNFVPGQVGRSDLAFLLDWILPAGTGTDLGPITLALACQNCDGLENALYALDPKTRQLACLQKGGLNGALAHACLDQAWIRSASLVVLCVANLKALEQAAGVRAYRHAMMAAGRVGQRVYLGAEALGWGCCGIGAIYDREAQTLLGLNPDSGLLYALAAGPVKKKIL